MAYPHPLRIEGLLAKEESTYGTDPTPSASTDAVRGVGRLWPDVQADWAFPNMREDVHSGGLVQVAPGTPKGRIAAIEIVVENIGSGAAYSSVTPVRPAHDALWMSCGMSRTHIDTGGSEAVTYALADTGHVSSTLYAYAGGKRWVLTGCRGAWSWSITAGGLGEVTFTLQGMVSSVTEVALPSITYDAVVPPPAVGLSLAMVPSGQSSYSPALASMSVTNGAQVQRLDDANATDGIEGFFISGFQPRVTMAPRVEDLSTYAAYTYAASRLLHTIDLTLGSTQYNRVDLDVNAAYLTKDPGSAEDNEYAAWELDFLCLDTAIRFD